MSFQANNKLGTIPVCEVPTEAPTEAPTTPAPTEAPKSSEPEPEPTTEAPTEAKAPCGDFHTEDTCPDHCLWMDFLDVPACKDPNGSVDEFGPGGGASDEFGPGDP